MSSAFPLDERPEVKPAVAAMGRADMIGEVQRGKGLGGDRLMRRADAVRPAMRVAVPSSVGGGQLVSLASGDRRIDHRVLRGIDDVRGQ